MSEALLTLSCPCCAGLLSVSEGDTNTVCAHCGNHLLLPWGTRRYLADEKLGRTGAVRSVRARLGELAPEALSSASLRTSRLYHVPFWSVTCRVDGYVLGTRGTYVERELFAEVEPAGGKPVITSRVVKHRTGSEAVEQRVSLALDVMISGARLEPLGIPSLGEKTQMALSGMELGGGRLPDALKVFDAGNLPEGVVVDPVVGITEAREEAGRIVERLSSGVGAGMEQRALHLVVTGRRERLVYYPLWIVDFTCSGRSYSAVVDGRTGIVLSGTFPADTKRIGMLLTVAGATLAALVPPLVHLLAGTSPQMRAVAFLALFFGVSALVNALGLFRRRMTGVKHV
jgi:hypothetical protein